MKNILITFFAFIAIKTQAQNTTNYTYDNLGRLKTVNYSNGGSITYNYDANGNRTTEVRVAGTLPVKWVSFVVKVANCNNVLLQWQTANEINNKGFVVEYIQDGNNYKTAGFIEANSSGNYSYTIPNLQEGSYYTRLKQIDLDGKFEYSTTQQVKISCNKNAVSISPNPVKNELIIKGLKPSGNNITIINALGKVVMQFTNFNAQSFNVSQLSKGFYIAVINKEHQVKFIKE